MGASGSSPFNLDYDKDKIKSNQNACLIDSTYDESENEENEYLKNLRDSNSNNFNLTNKNNYQSRLDINSIRFHEVCGKNVLITNNQRTAKRAETSFCDGIVFSNRPVDVYERVYVKITKLSSLWKGMIRFGFTSVNPESHKKNFNKISSSIENDNRNASEECLTDEENKEDDDNDDYLYDLPKYVYPDLTNKRGYWAGAMDDNSVKENDVIYFYVNSNGEIHYGINNIYKGMFLDGVDVYTVPQKAQHLWAIFDIYGNTISIELLNNQNDLNNNNNNNPNQSKVSSQNVQNNERLTIDNVSSIPYDSNNFRTFLNSSNEQSESLNTTSSSGRSISSFQPSISSTSSSISKSSLSSNMVTIIPNQHVNQHHTQNVVMRQNKDKNKINRRSVNENFDKLVISFRRLCVDNHLNETLQDSILDLTPIRSQSSASTSKSASLDLKKLENVQCKTSELNNKIKFFYESIPVLLHEQSSNTETGNKFLIGVHGKNVNICKPDCCIAYRESSILQLKDRHLNNSSSKSQILKEPTRNAYIFLDKPIEKGKPFCLQIVGIDQSPNESKMSLGIGCTTCDPNLLNSQIDLPDDADEFLDRPEYWIVFQNLFNAESIVRKHFVSLADELCFCLDEKTGNLNFSINGTLITNCLFNVDLTQKLWFFFDLCGKINAIRLIKSCQSKNPSQSIVNEITSNQVEPQNKNSEMTRKKRPNSALIDYFKSQLLPESAESCLENNDKSDKSKDNNKRNSNLDECRICLDAPIECVFYSCGHMCLCWNCATTLKKQASKSSHTQVQQETNSNQQKKIKNPICPICRVEIIDIIRFFKS